MSSLLFFAKRFVAGENASSALAVVKKLNQSGLVSSLDILGEDVSSELEAQKAAQEYRLLLDQIEEEKVQSNVSIKLSQMGLEKGDDFCFDQAKSILEKAKQLNNFVRVDMEGSRHTERTIRIFERLWQEFPQNIGLVLQAYLHRTETDVRELAKKQCSIRICKGAYKEPANIAFQNMNEIRENFKKLVEILASSGSKVAVATHDQILVDWAVDWFEKNNISKDLFEFQTLYGLKRKTSLNLAKSGYQVRKYIPYGTHWFPYFYRRLRERKENVFFVLKGLFTD